MKQSAYFTPEISVIDLRGELLELDTKSQVGGTQLAPPNKELDDELPSAAHARKNIWERE